MIVQIYSSATITRIWQKVQVQITNWQASKTSFA